MAKYIISLAVLLLIVYCGMHINKKLALLEVFGELQMRNLNIYFINEVDMFSVCGMDAVKANKNNKAIGSDDKDVVVGLSYSVLRGKYERIIWLSGLDAENNCDLIRVASNLYQTDSTYLDGLFLDNGKVHAMIYRKADPRKIDDRIKQEYWMWRDDIIRMVNNKIVIKNDEEMNEHLF